MEIEEPKIEDTEKDEWSLENKPGISNILKKLPDKIKLMETVLLTLEQDRGEFLSRKQILEKEIERKIESETMKIEEEKKVDKRSMSKEERESYVPEMIKVTVQKFKTQVQRDQEKYLQLMSDQEHKHYNMGIEKIKKTIDSNQITLSYLKRMFNAAGYLTLLGGIK